MNPNNDYDVYSALDGPEHITTVLQRFFSQKQNAYKYSLAKKHFDAITSRDKFIDAGRMSANDNNPPRVQQGETARGDIPATEGVPPHIGRNDPPEFHLNPAGAYA